MRERGILFSAPMVRAILNGAKTVTRRVVKPEHCPVAVEPIEDGVIVGRGGVSERQWLRFSRETNGLIEFLRPDARQIYHRPPTPAKVRRMASWHAQRRDGVRWTQSEAAGLCPYGVPGDRLWVRETWRKDSSHDPDDTLFRADVSEEWERANAGIVTWKPGIHLPRTRARITLDVVNVRVERLHAIDDSDAIREGIPAAGDVRPFARFAELWDAINGARSPWTSNPWVWRVEFKVAEVSHA